MYDYRGKLLNIIDGDTLKLEVDLGFNVFSKIRFRLEEINTPEKGQSDFDEASLELNNLLIKASSHDGYIYFTSKGLDKYGRWLIYIDGVNDKLKEKWPY